MSTKSILGTISLLLLLASSMLAVSTQLVKVTGAGYTQPLGLVGYWNFDQGSGTIAYDSSGYNNHGTIYGASWTTGKVNGALSFDGTNEYIDCGNNETLDPTQGATIEAWVNFNQLPSTAQHIMSIAGRSGGGTDLDLQTETDNKFKFYIDGSKVAVSNTVAETNKWYHIAGTYQANNNIKIYVNGQLEKTTSISVTRGTNPNNFTIGPSLIFHGRFFNGTIDEVKIFNRALSEEEIGTEYTSALPTPTPITTPSPTPSTTASPSPPPSTTSTTTISNNSATVDQSATTGVSVTVSGSSLQDGALLNVTSTNYGVNQPEGTGAVPVNAALFYGVDVVSNDKALGSDISGVVSLSDASFNSGKVIEYWNGNEWTSVATRFTAPDTVSCTINANSTNAHAAIPASALTGTPILVGAPKSSASTLTLSTTLLAIIIAIVVAIVLVLGIVFVYMRKQKAK